MPAAVTASSREYLFDEMMQVGVVDAADAEEPAKVDRRQDAVEDVGEVQLWVSVGRRAVEHFLQLRAALNEGLGGGVLRVVGSGDDGAQKGEPVRHVN